MSLTERKVRTPDRSRPTATLSVDWATYDRLDKLATKENAPIAGVITGLLNHHHATKSKKT